MNNYQITIQSLPKFICLILLCYHDNISKVLIRIYNEGDILSFLTLDIHFRKIFVNNMTDLVKTFPALWSGSLP